MEVIPNDSILKVTEISSRRVSSELQFGQLSWHITLVESTSVVMERHRLNVLGSQPPMSYVAILPGSWCALTTHAVPNGARRCKSGGLRDRRFVEGIFDPDATSLLQIAGVGANSVTIKQR